MRFLPGLSYGHYTGSLAYPKRLSCRLGWNQELLAIVLELVHPGNLGALPPSPSLLAFKAEQTGIAKYDDFVVKTWY